MTVLAILFLIFLFLRILLIWFDDGFGGNRAWDCIVWVSSLAWLIGALMAVHVLTGLEVSFR